MSQLTPSELYDWLLATIEESSSLLLLQSDDEVERRLLEDFDIDSRTFFHDDNLQVLLTNNLINEEVASLARQLRKEAASLRETSAWSISAVRSGTDEWRSLLALSDQILALVSSPPTHARR